MANVRAKFRCTSIKETAGVVGKMYEFAPCYDTSIEEDRRFSQYTPSGLLSMYVDNPAVDWKLGEYYYLDFAPVPAEADAAG